MDAAVGLPSRDLDHLESLIQAGEPEIALETLCTQMYEFGIPLTAAMRDLVASVGRQLRVDPSYWEVFGRAD